MLDAWQRPPQLLDHRAAIVSAAGIGDSVACDPHLRLDLLEAIDDRGCRHIRRADAPDRTDARSGEEGNDRFRDVRQIRCDAVARAYALCPQMQGKRCSLSA